MSQWAGFNVKVRINEMVYEVNKASVRDSVNDGDVTNSEGDGFGDSLDCIRRGEISLDQATFDDANNPFGVPQALEPRSTPYIKIYPSGLGGPYWNFPVTLITELSHDFDVGNLQPISLKAKNKGYFSSPDYS